MKFARKKSRYFIFASAALLLVLLAQPAQAIGTRFWVGPNPNTLWTNANNWSNSAGGTPGAGPPNNSSTFADLVSTSSKTAVYDAASSTIAGMTVDATGGGIFTLSMPANTLSVVTTEIIGLSGKGQVVQSGGINNSGDGMTLGDNTGSSGTYTLSGGGSLFTHLFQDIGYHGTGLFNQTGGSNQSNDSINLGSQPDGVGTYNLNGGHLQTVDETIGREGTGTFNQNATSTNIISGSLTLGAFLVGPYQGTGTYNMKGGWLQTVDETVGYQGKGTFTQSGGTHIIGHNLFLGGDSTGSGTFTLLAGSLSASNELIGVDGTGVFTQSGGTNTMNQLAVGFNFGSSGTYTLNAGQLQSNTFEQVGEDSTGVFTQKGGTNTAKQLTLGDTLHGNGTYNLVKGTLSVTTDETVGFNGIGTFNQTGGTHTVTNILSLGGSDGACTYNLQGGSLSAGTPFVGGSDIRINSSGTFNVKNTTTTVTGDVLNSIGGTVKTTNAKVTWNGNFVNSGAYISDPSTQTFNQDLTVQSTGFLVGGSQDVFIIKNDFFNFSTENTAWKTVLSSLKFVTGPDNSHVFYIPGLGATPANNFAWYSLDITGQVLHLLDSNGGGVGDQWLQVLLGAKFTGTTLTNIFNDDAANVLNLYYDKNLAANAYLHGLNYTINGGAGGMLIAHTPVPPSVLLLGSGLLGLGALGWRRRKM